MKIIRIIGNVVVLLIAYALGVLTVVLMQGRVVTLEHELDLSANYPFKNNTPPIAGVVRAGSEVEVTMLKGGVAYIRVPTVVLKTSLIPKDEEHK